MTNTAAATKSENDPTSSRWLVIGSSASIRSKHLWGYSTTKRAGIMGVPKYVEVVIILSGKQRTVGIGSLNLHGMVTLATFTCQPREAVIGRRQENQWLGELQRGTGPLQNPLFLANVTMPA